MPLRGELSRSTADNLVQLAHSIRPDWQSAGTRAGIKAALARSQTFTLADLTFAVVAAAENSGNRTPAVIGHDGDHWPKARPQVGPTDRCRDCGVWHPTNEQCAPGEERPVPVESGAEARERIRQEIAAAREKRCPHGVLPKFCNEHRQPIEEDA